jgi:hypothetical protein
VHGETRIHVRRDVDDAVSSTADVADGLALGICHGEALQCSVRAYGEGVKPSWLHEVVGGGEEAAVGRPVKIAGIAKVGKRVT